MSFLNYIASDSPLPALNPQVFDGAEDIKRLAGEDVFRELYGIPYEYRIVVTE